MEPSAAQFIYKVTSRSEWKAAQDVGVFAGAPIDFEDGYIDYVKKKRKKQFNLGGAVGTLAIVVLFSSADTGSDY